MHNVVPVGNLCRPGSVAILFDSVCLLLYAAICTYIPQFYRHGNTYKMIIRIFYCNLLHNAIKYLQRCYNVPYRLPCCLPLHITLQNKVDRPVEVIPWEQNVKEVSLTRYSKSKIKAKHAMRDFPKSHGRLSLDGIIFIYQ